MVEIEFIRENESGIILNKLANFKQKSGPGVILK